MRYLYSVCFYLILPFLFLRLWIKGKKNPAYRTRWAERLGFVPTLPKGGIWIHAVSFGEMMAAKPLVQALAARYPEKPILITNTTATGSTLAQKMVGNNIFHTYLPYDLPDAIHRFLNRVSPTFLILMETELWPNVLHYTARRHIPILLANARLSARALKSYGRIPSLTRSMLSQITCVGAQTQLDADHFIQLGAHLKQVQILGNLKFDMHVPMELVEKGRQAKTSRPTLIAASTHDGEEEIVLSAFKKVLEQQPDALLILVPRHPQRFGAVFELCQQAGFKVLRRTQNLSPLPLGEIQNPSPLPLGEGQGEGTNSYSELSSASSARLAPDINIFLGDTLGELFFYYAMSDIALVCGSLVDNIGGHNPLEAAALKLPILMGEYSFNIVELWGWLEKAEGAIKIPAEKLADVWLDLITDPIRRQHMGEMAFKVFMEHKGALEKHLGYIDYFAGR